MQHAAHRRIPACWQRRRESQRRRRERGARRRHVLPQPPLPAQKRLHGQACPPVCPHPPPRGPAQPGAHLSIELACGRGVGVAAQVEDPEGIRQRAHAAAREQPQQRGGEGAGRGGSGAPAGRAYPRARSCGGIPWHPAPLSPAPAAPSTPAAAESIAKTHRAPDERDAAREVQAPVRQLLNRLLHAWRWRPAVRLAGFGRRHGGCGEAGRAGARLPAALQAAAAAAVTGRRPPLGHTAACRVHPSPFPGWSGLRRHLWGRQQLACWRGCGGQPVSRALVRLWRRGPSPGPCLGAWAPP